MKKINRILSILLAFVVVITTFSSDLTTAHVFATEEEAVVESEKKISTVEKEDTTEPVVEAPVEGSTESAIEASTEGSTSTENVEETSKNVEDPEEAEENINAAVTGSDEESVVDPKAVTETEEDVETAESDKNDKFDSEAKSLSFTTDDGIIITLNAEAGVIPQDAELRVDKVEDNKEEEIADLIDEDLGEEIEVTKTFSYDINIHSDEYGDENGYVQPKGDVDVTFDEVTEAESKELSLDVYHVTDDLESAENLTENLEIADDATDITIVTDHFSIYTVTISHKKYPDYATKMNVKVVGVDYKELSEGIKNDFMLEVNSYKDTVSAAAVAEKMEFPSEYQFISFAATLPQYGTHNIVTEFRLKDNGYDHYDSIQYKTAGGDWKNLNNNTIYAVCRSNEQATTANHLDLGFEYNDFKKYYGKARVYAIVDGVEHTMSVDSSVYHEKFDGKDYYEYRYESNSPIKVTSKIEFRVVYEGITYYMTCDEAMNADAFERCFKSHSTIQNEFGFDYLSVFSKDFKLKGDVQYYKNDGTTAMKDDKLDWHGQSQDAVKEYTILSYEDTKLGENGKHIFKEWNTKADGSGKTYAGGDKENIKNGDKLVLYAIWEAEPTETVKVAVYATDGTNSKNSKGEVVKNEVIAGLLKLNYVQKDGYYPIGVVELPSDLFDGASPYINNTTDWEEVKAALESTKLDTSASVLTHGNVDNIVGDNLSSVQVDFEKTAGYYFTAMFDWNQPEYDGSIRVPDGQNNFEYHLDLRFATDIIDYYGVYFENGVKKSVSQNALYQEAVLKDSQKKVTEEEFSATDYVFDGFYLDENCAEKKLKKGDDLSKDVKKVYVKFVNAEVEKTYHVNYYLLNDDGSMKSKPDYTDEYTVKVSATDPNQRVYVKCEAEKTKDTSADLVRVTDEETHITKYSETFTDPATGIVYTERKSEADHHDYYINCNTKPGDADLNVFFKRVVPTGYKIVIEASANGGDTTLIYNGKPQTALMDVKATPGKISTNKGSSDDNTESDDSNDEGLFTRFLSMFSAFGVLHVSAAESNVEPLTVVIGGTEVTISGLNTTKGTGTHVGDYPFYLDMSGMAVTTKLDEKTSVDLSKVISVEVVEAKKLAGDDFDKKDSEKLLGYLHIKPASLAVYTGSASKTYNGEALTNPEASIVGLQENENGIKETATITATGSRTDVGSSTNTYKIDWNGTALASDYDTEKIDEHLGTLTVNPAGGNDDRNDDTPGTPTTVADTTVPAAPAAAVLGAVREPVVGDAPAVLGARRAGTSDTSILGSVITIIVAAAIAFSMVFIKRKKKEEN